MNRLGRKPLIFKTFKKVLCDLMRGVKRYVLNRVGRVQGVRVRHLRNGMNRITAWQVIIRARELYERIEEWRKNDRGA